MGEESLASGVATGFLDEDTWNAHSMTHAAMSIYSGYGTAADALGVAGKVIEAYRETMADQWDYRDTTTPYDDEGNFDPEGIPRPSVNSHYAPHRDLLGEGVADGAAGLSQWPVLLPHASALATLLITTDRFLCMEFQVLSGLPDLSSEST